MENRKILIDRSMRGLDQESGRIYEKSCPSILSRLYKEPHLILHIRKVDKMYEANTMLRAEQSRAEQSRAEQHDCCIRLGNAYDDEKFTGGNFGGNVWDVNGIAPTIKTGASASQQCHVEVKKMNVKIRQATKEGYIECELPGLVDIEYPSSQTRRGRVIRGGADKSDSDNGEYP